MKILLQISFFFLLVTQICVGQWYQQINGNIALRAIQFTNFNNGWTVGLDGTILKTSNGGTEWISISSGTTEHLFGLFFVNDSNGIVCGSGGKILLTSNGGTDWISSASGTTANLLDIYFSDFSTGWIVGENGTILKTTNGGVDWNAQSSGTFSNFTSVDFTDVNTGWIASDTMLKTTNAGIGWVSLPIALYKLDFIDNNRGWAIGNGLMNTTDGGINWTSHPILDTLPYAIPTEICFIDSNIGWITCEWNKDFAAIGTIIKTSDGGQTWNLCYRNEMCGIYNIYFIDDLTGWACGDGIILHTTNGGNPVPVELNSFSATANNKVVIINWSTATELNNQGFEVQRKFGSNNFVTIGSVKGQGTTTSPNNYSFVDKLFDAGKYFYRLKQIDYGGKYEYSQTVELNWSPFTTYKLEQNYPNPFNPITTIEYGVPRNVKGEKSNVKLKVFDVLGNEIATLVNEEKEAGSYEIEFNAVKLTSGVYFYQLKAGEFVSTKKMILLR